MELSDYRNQIDHIDKELIHLFAERMDVAAGIAAYKKKHGLAVLDPARERAKLLDVAEQTPEALQEYAVSLYSLLFELSRSYQNRLLEKPPPANPHDGSPPGCRALRSRPAASPRAVG